MDEKELASMDRFIAGDPLRGVALLAVVLTHLSAAVLKESGWLGANAATWSDFGDAVQAAG